MSQLCLAGLMRLLWSRWEVTGAACVVLVVSQMMNRSCLLRTLQRPRAGLRKGARRSVSANNAADAASQHHTPAAAVAAAAAAGLTSGGLCSDEANDVNREIAILKKLDHPNVVKLFEVIDPPGSQYMMLVMEFLEKGPVLQTHNQSGFDSLPEEVAADYFRQAVLGLEYLHFHKVCGQLIGRSSWVVDW